LRRRDEHDGISSPETIAAAPIDEQTSTVGGQCNDGAV